MEMLIVYVKMTFVQEKKMILYWEGETNLLHFVSRKMFSRNDSFSYIYIYIYIYYMFRKIDIFLSFVLIWKTITRNHL